MDINVIAITELYTAFIVTHKKILDYVAILTLCTKTINIINVSPVQLTSPSALLSQMLIKLDAYVVKHS